MRFPLRILARLPILRALVPDMQAAGELAARWAKAAAREPDLIADVMRLGRVLAVQPDTYQNGEPMGVPIDPVRLAYEAGQRDMAVQLLALMSITETELKSLLEEDYDV